MKRLLSKTILVIAAIALLGGCSDGNMVDEPMPDIIAGGAQVTKADLIEAVWGSEAELSPDVLCLVGSTFEITSDTPFSIARNPYPDDQNAADVVVISAVTISFDDAASDGRGGSCGEGMLQYMVQANESEPIDIVTSTQLRARHSLIHMVSGTHTEYPGCTIRAHFDKAGKEICDPSLIPDEEEDDVDDSADDSADDDADDIPVVTPIPDIFEFSAQRLSADGLPCSTEEVRSVKMVVDDYNCQLQGYEPRTWNE